MPYVMVSYTPKTIWMMKTPKAWKPASIGHPSHGDTNSFAAPSPIELSCRGLQASLAWKIDMI